MANIPTERRAEFAERSKSIKASIDKCLAREKAVLADIRSNSEGAEYKKLELADEMLYIATLYMSINSVSLKILETKNNEALNDSRKTIYKSIIYLEEVVSNMVDCAYSDLTPYFEKITNFKVEQRFYLVRKIGLLIQILSDALGDNSKWKWSFVELRARFTTVAKNLLDMKEAGKVLDEPGHPDHDTSHYYIQLVRRLLDKSSMDYRDKYELSTRSEPDMQMAINFLLAGRRIALVLGESDSAEEMKKKAGVWKAKMEADKKQGNK